MQARPRPTDDLVLATKDDLCLDFANTLYWRGTAPPTERLQEVADVLKWCGASGVLPAGRVRALTDWFRSRNAEGAASFSEAIALREIIYGVFAAVAARKKPRGEDLRALNRVLAKAPPRCELRDSPSGFGWVTEAGTPGAIALLAPVLWSAGDLLVSRRLDRIRRCANDACLWLFLDDSKSGNRRWCAMSACGNRAKAHRHYLRQRGA